MLEGDLRLGADVRDLGVGGGVEQFGMRRTAQDLDHDGLLGGAEGLHRLVMGGLGEVLAVHLEGEERHESEDIHAAFISEDDGSTVPHKHTLLDELSSPPQLVLQGHSRTKWNETLIRQTLSLINQGH